MQYKSSLARCILHSAVDLFHPASNTADDSCVASIALLVGCFYILFVDSSLLQGVSRRAI